MRKKLAGLIHIPLSHLVSGLVASDGPHVTPQLLGVVSLEALYQFPPVGLLPLSDPDRQPSLDPLCLLPVT